MDELRKRKMVDEGRKATVAAMFEDDSEYDQPPTVSAVTPRSAPRLAAAPIGARVCTFD